MRLRFLDEDDKTLFHLWIDEGELYVDPEGYDTSWIKGMNVVMLDHPDQLVLPIDGDRYLLSLAYEFRTPYIQCEFAGVEEWAVSHLDGSLIGTFDEMASDTPELAALIEQVPVEYGIGDFMTDVVLWLQSHDYRVEPVIRDEQDKILYPV